MFFLVGMLFAFSFNINFSMHFSPLKFIIGIFLIMFLINQARPLRSLGKLVIFGISGIIRFCISMVIVTWTRHGVEET